MLPIPLALPLRRVRKRVGERQRGEGGEEGRELRIERGVTIERINK